MPNLLCYLVTGMSAYLPHHIMSLLLLQLVMNIVLLPHAVLGAHTSTATKLDA